MCQYKIFTGGSLDIMRLKLLLCVLLLALSVNATTVVGVNDSLAVVPVDSTKVTRKHPWLAGLEVVGLNSALFGIDKIIFSDINWTKVTLKSIKRNLSQSYWFWDYDGLEVNAFRHPVHGSIFYLIGRANGMNMLESSMYSLGGSWMWEMFFEAERPSISDMVYTSVGGATIGEVAWRTGKSWLGLISKRHRALAPTVPFSTSITIGYRYLKSKDHRAANTAMATLDVSYGDLFDGEHNGPFDYFEASGTLAIGQNQKLINKANIDHQIISRSIVDKPNQKVVWGLYNHFDYYYASLIEQLNNVEMPSSLSYSEVGAIGPGVAYRVGRQQVSWEQQAYFNAIMMGATSMHIFHAANGLRDYNFGSGYGARLYSKLAVGNWVKLGVRAQFSHLFTWDGYNDDNGWKKHSVPSIQGETGNAVTTILEPSLEVKPTKNLSLVCNGRYMNTHNNYTYHPHGSISAWEWQVGVRYGIEL